MSWSRVSSRGNAQHVKDSLGPVADIPGSVKAAINAAVDAIGDSEDFVLEVTTYGHIGDAAEGHHNNLDISVRQYAVDKPATEPAPVEPIESTEPVEPVEPTEPTEPITNTEQEVS